MVWPIPRGCGLGPVYQINLFASSFAKSSHGCGAGVGGNVQVSPHSLDAAPEPLATLLPKPHKPVSVLPTARRLAASSGPSHGPSPPLVPRCAHTGSWRSSWGRGVGGSRCTWGAGTTHARSWSPWCLPSLLQQGDRVCPPGRGLHWEWFWGLVRGRPGAQPEPRKAEAALVTLVAAKTLPVRLLATRGGRQETS